MMENIVVYVGICILIIIVFAFILGLGVGIQVGIRKSLQWIKDFHDWLPPVDRHYYGTKTMEYEKHLNSQHQSEKLKEVKK